MAARDAHDERAHWRHSACVQGMPSESQQHALSVIAGMVPYYMPSSTLRTCLATFPVPSPPLSPLPSQPQAPSSGAAMLATETARMLREMRSEDSLHRYLKALQGLAGSRSLEAVPTMARVRLQIELYSLTTPGAPRWAPQAVR